MPDVSCCGLDSSLACRVETSSADNQIDPGIAASVQIGKRGLGPGKVHQHICTLECHSRVIRNAHQALAILHECTLPNSRTIRTIQGTM